MTLAVTMVDQPLTVRTHPSTAIFAKSEVAVGKLRLSPVAKTVHLHSKKKATTDPRHQCTLTCPKGRRSLYTMSTTKIDADLCNAFFLVAVTHVKGRGNMVLLPEVVPFITASATKLKVLGNEYNVKIPVLVNTSIIKQGDELLYYVPKAEVEKKPTELKGLEMKASSSKRAKV